MIKVTFDIETKKQEDTKQEVEQKEDKKQK